jgi:hypothetical protein
LFYTPCKDSEDESFDASIESVSKHLKNTMKTEVQMVSTYSFQAGRKDGMIPGFIENRTISFETAIIFIPSLFDMVLLVQEELYPAKRHTYFEIEL